MFSVISEAIWAAISQLLTGKIVEMVTGLFGGVLGS